MSAVTTHSDNKSELITRKLNELSNGSRDKGVFPYLKTELHPLLEPPHPLNYPYI
jgi:hypothetical protein